MGGGRPASGAHTYMLQSARAPAPPPATEWSASRPHSRSGGVEPQLNSTQLNSAKLSSAQLNTSHPSIIRQPEYSYKNNKIYPHVVIVANIADIADIAGVT